MWGRGNDSCNLTPQSRHYDYCHVNNVTCMGSRLTENIKVEVREKIRFPVHLRYIFAPMPQIFFFPEFGFEPLISRCPLTGPVHSLSSFFPAQDWSDRGWWAHAAQRRMRPIGSRRGGEQRHTLLYYTVYSQIVRAAGAAVAAANNKSVWRSNSIRHLSGLWIILCSCRCNTSSPCSSHTSTVWNYR